MLLVIGLSLQMESFKSKLLPLIIGILVFIMAALDLIKSTAAGDGKEVVFSQGVAVEAGGVQGRGRRYLYAASWVLGFFLAIYSLGFVVAIPLYILAYMKFNGISWTITIVSSAAASAMIYWTFEIVLQLDLYRGLLFDH